jgi:hypothetical protein
VSRDGLCSPTSCEVYSVQSFHISLKGEPFSLSCE